MTSNFSRSLATRLLSAAAVFAVAAFLFGCAQPTSAPNSITRVSDSHAAFDIPTPTLSGPSTVSSGGTVTLSWSNGGTVGSEASGGEFWGSTQSTAVTGSGHTDIFQDGVKIGESTTGTYDVSGLADASYSFTVQEKSLEGSTPNQMTHHSLVSSAVSVQVGSNCWNDDHGTISATVESYAVGTGTWSNTSVPAAGNTIWTETAMWTKTSQGNGYNIAFNVDQYDWIHNTCTGYSYSSATGYHGDIWVKLDNGTWLHPTGQWAAGTHEYYQINGQSLGTLTFGSHTLYFATQGDNAHIIGHFIVMGN